MPGRINFSDRALDATTGTYSLRAEFPTATTSCCRPVRAGARHLRPDRQCLVVPDRAVQEQLGRYFLTVVGEGDKAELRPVELGPRFGIARVITSASRPATGGRGGLAEGPPGAPLQVIPVKLEDFDARRGRR